MKKLVQLPVLGEIAGFSPPCFALRTYLYFDAKPEVARREGDTSRRHRKMAGIICRKCLIQTYVRGMRPRFNPSGLISSPDYPFSAKPDRSVSGVFWGSYPENRVFLPVLPTDDNALRITGEYRSVPFEDWVQPWISLCTGR